jgi:hypothetical protein
VRANVDEKYQRSQSDPYLRLIGILTGVKEVLSVLDKIIRLTSRQAGTDIAKLSRWLRCLFNLALSYDESISFHCAEQVVSLATKHHGVSHFNSF